MHPAKLFVKDFSFELPEEKIAKYPLTERDQSKLLIYRNHLIQEDLYSNLYQHLPQNAFLVFNDTKVMQARIFFQKPTGGMIEIFILEPDQEGEYFSTMMNMKEKVRWKCLIGGAGKWKHGQVLEKQVTAAEDSINVQAEIVGRSTDNFIIEFRWKPTSMTFAEILNLLGVIPIPPYLKRETELQDEERYQTIYASQKGSVAAPTAGLHFTAQVFQSLKARNIQTGFITLHVGAGTFMPVKTETLEEHHMHAEFLDVEYKFIQTLIDNSQNVFAVGTTSLRTLESLYWMGVKSFVNPETTIERLEIKQWEVYETLHIPILSVREALFALLYWMEANSLERLVLKTQILIAPGYRPKIIRGLITNFHQPNSTLLLLVAALIGDEWRNVYNYALQNDFRFLSYGDGSILYID